MSLPYFEGDFWPGVIEDCMREVGDEVARRREEITEADEGVMFVSWATVERKGDYARARRTSEDRPFKFN